MSFSLDKEVYFVGESISIHYTAPYIKDTEQRRSYEYSFFLESVDDQVTSLQVSRGRRAHNDVWNIPTANHPVDERVTTPGQEMKIVELEDQPLFPWIYELRLIQIDHKSDIPFIVDSTRFEVVVEPWPNMIGVSGERMS